MDDFKLVFKSVDPDDKEGLLRRAYAAIKFLKAFAIISLALIIVFSLLTLILTAEAIHDVGSELILKDVNSMNLFYGVLVIFVVIGIQLFTVWYVGKLKQQLLNGEIPSLTVPYIFIILSVLSLFSTIRPKFSLIGFIINAFILYLWYVLIISIKKLD